jgi:threonine-phosphate decarboxylase
MNQNNTLTYKNFVVCMGQRLHNAFMADNPSIWKKERIFMVTDFPERAVHGGTGKRQQEKTRKNVLDFSASINPFPPRVPFIPDPGCLAAYPDDTYALLKERIGSVFHRDPEEICVGNGSIELIRAFCTTVFRHSARPATFFLEPPTFGEYGLSARLAGATQVHAPAGAAVSFLCNPNNPTGQLLSANDVRERLHAVKGHGGMLFCDEAFIELADPRESVAGIRDPDLFVLRSLTKCFAVPGIRFGYGFGKPSLIEKIETVRAPWSVNAFAEAYAMEAILCLDQLAASRSAITAERDYLEGKLRDLGLQPAPSRVNYLLAECGRDAAALCACLAENGILVRDCTSFGLPTSIRIAVRTREENRALIGALESCVR